MNNFLYYAPTKVYFGKDTEKDTGKYVKEYGGSSVVVIYGGESAKKSGLIDRIEESLEKEGLKYKSIGGVVKNPHISLVYDAIAIGKEIEADFILAVGGGSVIDSAKACAYGLADPDRDVWELYEHEREAIGCLPVGVVLTIAAAGSETSDSSVVTNEKTGDKRAYNDDIARPKFAVMNPDITKSVPVHMSLCGAADIMMHTIERYLTSGGNMEITDSISEALLRTVITYSKVLLKDPENYEARAEIMWAGSLSHNGLTGCGNAGGDFASHMMEHELGGMFDVVHGAGLTAIWATWGRYVYKDCVDRFEKLARNVFGITGDNAEEVALKCIDAAETFFAEVGLPIRINELNINPTDEQLKDMAARSIRAAGGPLGSAKILHEEDVYNILKAAM